MPATKPTRAKSPAKPPAKPPVKPPNKRSKTNAKPSANSTAGRLTLDQVMRDLEKAGSEQTRKTYRRHGAKEPMFGVSFATLKTMVKRIKVDHDLAMQLWHTGNHDARMLAIKIADPAKMKAADLDRWAKGTTPRMCGGYATMLAAEGPHGEAKCRGWIKSSDADLRAAGWLLLGHLATLNEQLDDSWLLGQLAEIEKSIHVVSNSEREAMNGAVIAIGGRTPALRKAATAAAKRIGTVHVDHGDTACKTPDAAEYIDKTWAHAKAKKFGSPAAQERAREPMRTRC